MNHVKNNPIVNYFEVSMLCADCKLNFLAVTDECPYIHMCRQQVRKLNQEEKCCD